MRIFRGNAEGPADDRWLRAYARLSAGHRRDVDDDLAYFGHAFILEDAGGAVCRVNPLTVRWAPDGRTVLEECDQ